MQGEPSLSRVPPADRAPNRWIAFFAVGGVIAYGLISGLTKEEGKPAAVIDKPGSLKAD